MRCRPSIHPFLVSLVLSGLPIPACLAQTPATPAADSTLASPYPATPPRVEQVVDLTDGARYAEAESLGWAVVQDYETSKGPDSFEVARALEAYLEAIARQRKVDERAFQLADRAIRIASDRFGPEHPEVARALGVKASLKNHSGDLEGAIELRKQELALLRKNPGPDKGILGSAAANTAVSYAMLARYEEATPYFLEAVDAFRDAYGEENMETAGAIFNVGNLYNIRGEYDEAQKYYLRALHIYEKTLDPDHPRTRMAVTSLGDIEVYRGNYTGARDYYRRGLKMAEQREGSESLSLVSGIRGLGNVERLLGNLDRALELHLRALRISEAHLKHDDYDLWAQLLNVGEDYVDLGRSEKARPYLTRAVAVVNARASNHDELVTPLTALAKLERTEGHLQAAADTLMRALTIAEATKGPTNDQTGNVHSVLSAVYEDMGDYEAAAKQAEGVIAAYASGWRDRQGFARALLLRSRIRLERGDLAGAFTDARDGEKQALKQFRATYRSLAEMDALRFSAFRGNGIPLMITALGMETTPSDTAIAAAWDAVVRSRGILLEEIAARRRLIHDQNDPELAALARNALEARSRLAALYLRGPEGQDPERFQARLDAASRQKEEAETALAEASATFREETRAGGLDAVRKHLPADAALVAYVRYARGSRSRDAVPSYAAFGVSGPAGVPWFVDLGPAAAIEARVQAWRDAVAASGVPAGPLAREAEKRVRTAGAALREAILDPIGAHLAGARQVLIVPDGDLHLVNPAALPDQAGGYLVESGPLFHQLPAERALLRGAPAAPAKPTLLALGGPAFDRELRPSRPAADLLAAGERNIPQRGGELDCDEYLDLRFSRLPDAEKESRDVAALWRRGNRGAADVLTGAEATESAFKAAAPGHTVLHLATHGYFLDPECGRTAGDEVEGTERWENAAGNPLLLSGLALAGANRHGSRPGGEDGILSAEEIATLDLRSVAWAVLSACDTGRGALVPGEGVFGLQRAFQTAGARTVIMSLWPVDDRTTREWMQTLYRARWQDGLGTAEAVREAARSILRERREQGAGTSPIGWGAFVATGDWR